MMTSEIIDLYADNVSAAWTNYNSLLYHKTDTEFLDIIEGFSMLMRAKTEKEYPSLLEENEIGFWMLLMAGLQKAGAFSTSDIRAEVVQGLVERKLVLLPDALMLL